VSLDGVQVAAVRAALAGVSSRSRAELRRATGLDAGSLAVALEELFDAGAVAFDGLRCCLVPRGEGATAPALSPHAADAEGGSE
jgi:hypothetical protein